MKNDELRAKLERALSPAVDAAKTARGGGIVIYGAGNTSDLYETAFQAEGIEPVCFIDNAPSKHGIVFHGKPVINIEEARKQCRDRLILVSAGTFPGSESILKSLREKPVEGAVFMTVDEFIFRGHASEILEVFDWLEDDLSKETYVNMLLARMHMEPQRYELTRPDQYFGIPEFTVRSGNEVFVDCGAYVGDSAEQYLNVKDGTFKKIYAFEPDKRNFAAMKARFERLCREWAIAPDRIVPINAGVGEKSVDLILRNSNQETPSLSAGFSTATDQEEGDQIAVVSLDEYFSGQEIGFLKADIESFEFPMLLGAEHVIQRDRPMIAICIYHNPSDMFRIAQKLKALVPEYHLAVRQHKCELSETILYAWQ